MSKAKTVEVSKISLQIGKKKKIELSLEEARELQQILTDLLGLEAEQKCNRITIIPGPSAVTVPYPYLVSVLTHPGRWGVDPPFWVGDSSNTGTITISSNSPNTNGVLTLVDKVGLPELPLKRKYNKRQRKLWRNTNAISERHSNYLQSSLNG